MIGPLPDDVMHEAAMVRGSLALLKAVHSLQGARHHGLVPQPAVGEFRWRRPYQGGTKDRPQWHPKDVANLLSNRQPCGRCGVRQDFHDVHGCAAFAVAVSA